MTTCGIDIGSTTIEVVVLHNATVRASALVQSGSAPAENASRLLTDVLRSCGLVRSDLDCVVATGFGRNYCTEADRILSEIACHAAGVSAVFPGTRTVIEIGGQDSKMIRINGRGHVEDFVMNDRCAAGTGRFVEAVARSLNVSVAETGALGLQAARACTVSSMCAVFAETEIIGLLHQGNPPREILRGVFEAVARRVIGMAGKIGVDDPLVFTGGVARNVGIARALETVTGHPVLVPEAPEYTGALGAALLGAQAM